jgi:hypothetical protein
MGGLLSSSKELRMNKSILVGLAILAASTSAASAWTHRTHHSRATHPAASAAATTPNRSTGAMNAYGAMGAPSAAMPGVTSKEHSERMKSLHDSGYDPKKDLTPSGTMRQQ